LRPEGCFATDLGSVLLSATDDWGLGSWKTSPPKGTALAGSEDHGNVNLLFPICPDTFGGPSQAGARAVGTGVLLAAAILPEGQHDLARGLQPLKLRSVRAEARESQWATEIGLLRRGGLADPGGPAVPAWAGVTAFGATWQPQIRWRSGAGAPAP